MSKNQQTERRNATDRRNIPDRRMDSDRRHGLETAGANNGQQRTGADRRASANADRRASERRT